VLQTAGAVADRALLWAIPRSDLQRSTAVINSAGRPELVWAPLVDHGGTSRDRVRTIAAYSVLNSHPSVQARWGISPESLAELRKRLVGGGAATAQDLVPEAALDDLILSDPSPASAARVAAAIGAPSLAIPAFAIAEVAERVAWAREVL
jgi:hypothetical protein